ncbi:MAG: hypothetical protein KF718_23485 [Polyangiaceae bacterium]|nr:hypothetical protein [Polyangiaceae bacterium]
MASRSLARRGYGGSPSATLEPAGQRSYLACAFPPSPPKSSRGKHETLSASGSKGDLSVFATIPKLGTADFRDWRFGQLRKATDSASWLDVDAAVVVEVKKNSVYDAEASKALLGKLTGQ